MAHLPITPPNTGNALPSPAANANTNAAWIASNPNRLPAGAITVTYDIKSVSRNASKQPVMVFRMLQNGQRADLNTFATATPNPATGPRRSGTTSWARRARTSCSRCRRTASARRPTSTPPSSGYLRRSGTARPPAPGAGTLTGPDARRLLHRDAHRREVPDNAVMLTGGMGFSYNVYEHTAADADQRGTIFVGVRPAATPSEPVLSGCAVADRADQQDRRPDRDRAQRQKVADRLHRPARDRRGRALQRVPPGARRVHRGRVPWRPA